MKTLKNIVTVFGSGNIPKAPGTFGALAGLISIILFRLACRLVGLSDNGLFALEAVITLGIILLGVYALKKLSGKIEHDASFVVIDEFAGIWVSMLFVPSQWYYLLLAFVLFRFFDIAKPLFIKRIDRMKNDWSIMLDDVLAGVYTNIILQIIIYFSIL